ncbi:MAG: GWxTD domain-containing protein [Bacteroidales bacterium]|nr:GWxTD domain-containing protein [Bacteroidales bacterium]
MNIRKLIMMVGIALMSLSAMAQSEKQNLSAMFGYSTFYLADQDKPYVETYLSFDAWSLNFAKEGAKYKATVEVTLIVKSGDSIVYWKKYDLNSPVINNPEENDFFFLDLQRFGLKNGIYNLELTLKDKNSTAEAVTAHEKLYVQYDKKKPAMSSVQIMSSIKKTSTENMFSRNGYDMQPYVSDLVPEQFDKLHFYYEIYNISEEIGFQPFMTYAFIEDKETGRRAGEIQKLTKHQYKAGNTIVPEFTSFDISRLPSGNYNLVVEVHNRQNECLMYKKVSFYRSNPKMESEVAISEYAATFAGQIKDENQLNYYLDALYPIASEKEKAVINHLVKIPAMDEKQMFFYKFWLERDKLNPADKWDEYKTRLEYVDQNFSFAKMKGYQTDRGRVYLQYGAPNFVRDEKNFVSVRHLGSGVNSQNNVVEGSYVQSDSQGHIYYKPYQLWRYDLLPNDNPTRCFIFWDEFRVGNYQLLNSNARGEVQDPKWERRLCGQQLNEDVVGEVGEQFERGY